MTESPVSDLTRSLSDAAYVAVGFGVIAFQKAQVRRRELEKQLAGSSEQFRDQLVQVVGEVEDRIEPLVDALETSLELLEERLPEPAREVVKSARTTAREATDQLRALLGEIQLKDQAAA